MPSFCASCSKQDAKQICSRCKCTYYCNIDCQRSNWKIHKKICKTLANKNNQQNNNDKDDDKKEIFRIEKIEEKGYGMIANCDIKTGTMILNEDPLLFITSEIGINIRSIDIKQFENKFAKPLLQKFKDLTKDDQLIINDLSYKHDGSVLDKFLNNCLTNEENNFDGVYPQIARINHECNSNAIQWILPKNKKFNARIIAIRDIKKNEEITINYLGHYPLIYKQRKEKLMDGWKIKKCKCLFCDIKTRDEFDKLILKYKKLDDSIPKIRDFKDKYNACKDIISLIKNKFNSNPQLLYRHCWDLAQSCLYIMKRDQFIDNLINTVKYKYIAHGKDTGIPTEVKELIDQMPVDIQRKINSKLSKLKKL